MLTFVASLAAHQIGDRGSLLDFAHEIRKASVEKQRRKASSPPRKNPTVPKKRSTKYLRIGGTSSEESPPNFVRLSNVIPLEALPEAPHPCCALYDAEEISCIRHPQHRPHEYYSRQFKNDRECLERAYRVNLFVFQRRCRNEFLALHKERRETLGLEDVAPEEDFPRFMPQKRQERKRYLGKLCLLHKLDFDQELCGCLTSETCFICRSNQLRKRQVKERNRIYEEYCDKVAGALHKVHLQMGWKLFECDPPSENRRAEYSQDPTRNRLFIHVTDWSENQKGEIGNFQGKARRSAKRQARVKAKVWSRIQGNEHTQFSGRMLETIVEED
ncbi:hypothetical protein AB5N19_05650 [Seiridium cardinale]|uniref:Uncharacterized protein n=1 Tax=Seiridium cardinale TaxID=138064 RepID=A0ABR2XCN2_9PEZI